MLWLTGEQAKILCDFGESAYPAEACALLIGNRSFGDQWYVRRVIASPNRAADVYRYFEIDPGLRIGLERELRGSAEQVVGVWHSHPNGIATPSSTDRASVYEPELVWLITAIVAGQAVATDAFRFDERLMEFRSLSWHILPSP